MGWLVQEHLEDENECVEAMEEVLPMEIAPQAGNCNEEHMDGHIGHAVLYGCEEKWS